MLDLSKRRNSLGLMVVVAAIVVSSCATERAPPGPPTYREGWKQGCDSGYVAAGHPYYRYAKNVSRFNADELYKQGWNDGYDLCKTRYSNIVTG